MKPLSVRIALLVALAVVAGLAWYKPLETAATSQADAGLQRALVSFGTARALNAILSVAQGTQVAIEPAGVGINFAPGQVLKPVNDLVGQFAELMLAASIAFGVMKLLIVMGSHWVVSLLLMAFALGWGWFRWRGQPSQSWIAKILFVLLLVRFAVPLVTDGSDALFHVFMKDDYAASQQAIALQTNEISPLVPSSEDVKPREGLLDRFTAWLPGKFDVGGRLEKLKLAASQSTEHMIKIIVVFLMQTLVMPLLLFWILYRVGNAVLNPRRVPA